MKRNQILAAVAVAAASVVLLGATAAQVPARGTPTAAAVDWTAANAELLRHFQALVRIDTQDPPGNETKAVEYIKKVLDADGIPVIVAAKDAARANAIARLAGNGSKRPVLIMGHTDTVKVDPSKWKFPPFSATRDGGYVYGRGVLDNKWQVAANIETMLLLKRRAVPLDRDVIFVAEAGEEAATGPGIEYLVNERWNDIDAEYCIAEAGEVVRRGGQLRYAMTETAEKQPRGARLVARGPSGHGSRPLRSSAVLHLAQAIEKVALWDPPMRLNETTRTYFRMLAAAAPPAEAARYTALLDAGKAADARAYLAEHEPMHYSMLHTSISPDIISGGFQVNVIPSEAEATLDIRALPDENMDAFYDQLRRVIDDPAVTLVPNTANQRPGAAPSRMDTDMYRAIEAANKKVYNVPTLPYMQTGATDMAFLRAKGMQCYGVSLATDEEDTLKGFAAHSDQERVLEDSLYRYLQFQWEVLGSTAFTRR
ncbi:MAG TPA: M20/M25/M40 family metallo-hydrolase [Vicinamibacterales bacterium]|nr:M20/M25/M40 family metallo-hydrolase [Vicinamibacterales bacterium]